MKANAYLTVDRFHVAKMIYQELNQARISQKQTSQSLNIKEITRIFDGLKGSRYTLLKAENKLSIQQK